jgi:molecular chaperone DnaJ
VISSTCPDCGGAGSVIKTPCEACRGRGEVRQDKKVKVSIPAGIDNGQAIRLGGLGEAGEHGGPNGHLLVAVEVEGDERFQREGTDLATEIPVSFTQAALGTKVKIETLDDKTLKLEIPAGTQPGEIFTFEGEGVPYVDGPGRGRLLAVVKVEVPKKLTSKQRKALEELEKAFADGK